LAYNSYKRILKFENGYVIRYSDFKRIGRLEGEFLIDYRTYKRVARLECPGKNSALAAAAYFLN
jgi:hypothetical protein